MNEETGKKERLGDHSRRRLLQQVLGGAGYAGLRAMATGLPASFFLSGFPSSQAMAAADEKKKFLIMSSATHGCPLNAYAPGTYDIDRTIRSADPRMRAVQIEQFGGVTGGLPWASLGNHLNRSCFLHHRTYTNNHGALLKVLQLMGSARTAAGSGTEQLGSLIASENAAGLGTLQRAPVPLQVAQAANLGYRFEGRALSQLRPVTLKSLIKPKTSLTTLREETLGKLHSSMRQSSFTKAQKNWLDRYVQSRQMAQNIDDRVLGRLAAIERGVRGDMNAAIALILMKVTPATSLFIPFGIDNHKDEEFLNETEATLQGVEDLKYLFDSLQDAGIANDVIFATLNVFGRTLHQENGRNHHGAHHAMFIWGEGVRPGIAGGLELTVDQKSGKFAGHAATPIDSMTGAGGEGGDIPREESLEAAAKTLAKLTGMSEERINKRIVGGKIIRSVLMA